MTQSKQETKRTPAARMAIKRVQRGQGILVMRSGMRLGPAVASSGAEVLKGFKACPIFMLLSALRR